MKSGDTVNYLLMHDVKPSVQRMAVMDYLQKHRTHPTVDVIYNDLVKQMPTLSRTTVYNTLKLLADKHAVKLLTIDERSTCFDGDTSPHAHFLCTRCGKVFDMEILVEEPERMAKIPDGFCTEQAEVYFRGICPECNKKDEDKE